MIATELTDLTATIAQRIAASTIDEAPFPHIVIDDFLPPSFYAEVLHRIPPRSEFDAVDHPGAGFGARGENYRDFGYTLRRLRDAEGVLGTLHAAFESEATARALLEKFATHPLAVPFYKRDLLAGSAGASRTVCDLQVDLPGYAIAPHADVASELINFELHLAEDDSLARYGTNLCIPDHPRVYKGRPRADAAAGALLSRLPPHNRLFRRLERSSVGLRLGVGATAGWLPQEWFRIVKVIEALPNRFVAFAPNDRSFHSSDFSVSAASSVQERIVVRGSVQVGAQVSALCQKN